MSLNINTDSLPVRPSKWIQSSAALTYGASWEEQWAQHFDSYFLNLHWTGSCFRNTLGTFCDSSVLLAVEPVSPKGQEGLWMQLPPHDMKGSAGVHRTSVATDAYIPQQKKNKSILIKNITITTHKEQTSLRI